MGERILFEFAFCSCVGLLIQMAFQVAVHELVRIQVWAVAWQIKNLNQILICFQPGLQNFAVMNSQIVQNQDDFSTDTADQALQEFNEQNRWCPPNQQTLMTTSDPDLTAVTCAPVPISAPTSSC